jgi:hypothetical protein
MGKHVAAGNVTHHVDAFDRRLQAVVDLDVAARVRLQVRILDADVIAVRYTTDAEEQRFAITAGVGAISLGDPDVKPRAVVRSRCNRRIELYRHALSEALDKNSTRFVILAVE